MIPAGWDAPFAGLPPLVAALFWLALIIIVGMLAWVVVLFVRGWRAAVHAPDAPPDAAAAFTWVFLVPALNEEVTVRDSVDRLLGLDLKRRLVVVINDGSDDRTGEILESIHHPDLMVVTRRPPEARKGKAAALNQAYREVSDRLGHTDRSRVIVVIVDADGRLHPDAPRYVAGHFEDERVGGVQALVRIYNRHEVLTWCQNVEFSIYGHLYQAGRNGWGTAGMGGNGQFNRLSALDDIATGEGPWRDRLTEDQDLGLRLIAQGWEGRQELRASVDQQGVPSLMRLFRQRTRWSQGNLQALRLFPEVLGAPFSPGAVVELVIYLLSPVWQAIVGVAVVVAIACWALGIADVWDGNWWELVYFYVLAFGGTILGCVAPYRARGWKGWVTGFFVAQGYAFYTWLLWPVLVRSVWRMATAQRTWAKTDRVPIDRAGDAEDRAATPV